MKITFLTRLYYPHIGGVEKHVRGLVKEFSKTNEITIITEKYSSELPDKEIVDGANILRIPLVGVGESAKKWVIWKWILGHSQLLLSSDIIHVHDIMFWLIPLKLLHPLKKVFATFHGWEGVYPLPLKNIFQKRLDAFLAVKNICIGDYISKWYGFKSDVVSYGAVDLPIVKLVSRPKAPTLLFLGRLDEDTGFSQCLDIYHQLKSKYKWKLIIAGDGPLCSLVPSEAEFLGLVSNPDTLISSSTYVFTTGYLGILEAWIQKKPVISSYSNPLKRDYLLMHPMGKYLLFNPPYSIQLPREAYNWAKDQTWAKLAEIYKRLWLK